jgi:hypothetical protein
MKLLTQDDMIAAQRIAISNKSDIIECKVVQKLKNACLQPHIEEKLTSMLNDNPNFELTTNGVIRNAQSIVNKAFKSKSNHDEFSKNIYEAIELLALSLVVADDKLVETRKKELV